MKLSYEDKVQIYELRKQGISFKRLSDKYGMYLSNLKYLVRLIDRYGIEIVKKGKSHYYSPELKQEMIDKVLLEGCSHRSVSLDYALPSSGLLSNWLANTRKTSILLLRKQEGDQLGWDVNGSILPTKERLARKQRISFNASLKQPNQWKSAIQM